MPRYIDADKLREVMERYDDYAVDIVDDAPTADVVERKKGKWMKHNDKACWYCSECKKDNYYAYCWNSDTGKYEFQDHYCPNCGAEMEGEEE